MLLLLRDVAAREPTLPAGGSRLPRATPYRPEGPTGILRKIRSVVSPQFDKSYALLEVNVLNLSI